MFLTKKHLPRRTFLRGIGATIALPLLDSMVPSRTALAQTAAKPMLRAGFIYIPMGAQMPQWTPIGDKPGFKYSRILKPIEAFRDRINIVTGTSLIAENGHALSNSMWLNGTKPAHGTEIRGGTTIDQIIAQKIGQDTTFPSLEIATEDHASELGSCGGDYACAYMNTISWRTPTTPNPMELNPRVLFERMFGGDGATAEARVARLRDNLSILDGVTQSVGDLSKGLDSKDKARLIDYMENLREIERRIAKAEKQNSESTGYGAPNAPVGIPDSFEEHATLLFDLWAIASQANITRVVSFMLARELSTRTYPQIGVPDGHHPVSHHQNDLQRMEMQAKINTYHMEMFAAFLPHQAEGHARRRRQHAGSFHDFVRQRHEQQQRTRSRPTAHPDCGRRGRPAQGRPPYQGEERHPAVEPPRGHDGQGRRAHRSLRRQLRQN